MALPLERATYRPPEPSPIRDAQITKEQLGYHGIESALANLSMGYDVLRRIGAKELFLDFNDQNLRNEGKLFLNGDLFLKPRSPINADGHRSVGRTINSMSLRWGSATERWKDDKGEEFPVLYQLNMSVINGQDLAMVVTRDNVKQHLHAIDIFSFSQDALGRLHSVKNRAQYDSLLPFRLPSGVGFDAPVVIDRARQWAERGRDNSIQNGLAQWHPHFLPYNLGIEPLAA